MSLHYERRGPLTELSSYPQWAQDMVDACETTKREIVNHDIWPVMCSLAMTPEQTSAFMVGLWPVIEGFPGYMARSLLKTRYGRSAGDDMARRWLVRNIRVEQNHAEYWLRWAEGAGVPRETLLRAPLPAGTQELANWCIDVSANETLAVGMAATNYAVEGATGEWAKRVYESDQYAASFPEESRKASLRWLQQHAAYDDEHPWQALEIVCSLLGESPSALEVAHIKECICRSYVCMRLFADRCVQGTRAAQHEPQFAARA